MESDSRRTCVSTLAIGKGREKPPLGIWTIRQYPCRSGVWIHTTSVDKEVNVRWSRISDPSEWRKPKSHLEELASIQIHNNCKKTLIVGFISMPEKMSCDRKMCTLELMQYYLFPNWPLLVPGMPFFLNPDQVLRSYFMLLVCRLYRNFHA